MILSLMSESKIFRKLWPRKLAKQLALVNVFILSITMIGFASFSASQQSADKIKILQVQVQTIANHIASLASGYIKNRKYRELEVQLSRITLDPGISAIRIDDLGFQVLVAFRRQQGGRFVHDNKAVAGVPPAQGHALVRNNSSHIEFWHAIYPQHSNDMQPIAWVQLEYGIESINRIHSSVLKQNLTIAVIAIFMSLIMLKWLMQRPMQALKKAVMFAEWLDVSQGGQVEVDCSSQEIELLARSLNRTSNKLHAHEETQRSAGALLDAIREVQTQYISELDVSILFENVLAKFVQLTQSEYGFIGEVIVGGNRKQYVKMRVISNLLGKEDMQTFRKHHAPENMEFHNIHTLFGTVLQTKKPTIANDPLNDPRRGGLPKGHPPLYAFLGLPIFYGKQLVGIVGLANRQQGYNQAVVAYVQPLLSTVGHIINATRIEQKRRDAQAELQESTVRFATILNTIADGVITFDKSGTVETINPASTKILGYERKDIVGKNINRFISGLHSNTSITLSAYHHLSRINKSEDASWQTEGRRQDGSVFPIEIEIDEFVLAGVKKYTLTLRDITRRQKTEQNLRNSEQRLKQAQRIAHLGSWQYNPTSHEMSCSSETLNILDLNPEQNEDLYNNIIDRIHPEDRQIFTSSLELIVTNGKPFSIDLRIIHPDESESFLYCQGAIDYDHQDKQCHIIGTFQDATDNNRMGRVRDEFISAVSHQLRAPLTSIRGSLSLVTNNLIRNKPEQAKSLLDNASRNTDRLLALLNNLLDIERIETGQFVFEMVPMQVMVLLKRVVSINQPLAEEYGITFRLNTDLDHSVYLLSDENRLMQVLGNLLSNAVAHSPNGSIVDVSANCYDENIRIYVTDYGERIPEEMKATLFEKSTYLQTPHGLNIVGTGLGLSISKSIIERHGGSLSFESDKDNGTCFCIDLPLLQQNSKVSNL